MDESELNTLFARLLENFGPMPEDIEYEKIKPVFSIMVSSTLRYRDHLKSNLGMILTVEDVRCALKYLIESIHSGQLPDTNNLVYMELYQLWTDELKDFL